ncbi:hypothetical protein BWR17_00285 [Phaeobacter inhibens]|uniref:DUF302 domain-containing protein n=1 Tax=Phaeobacter inhibens TaxID=221822 RepID=UPI000971A50A|nr:DUF302 domain-containing protein [Phaeobacter inhibens]APX14432.1 hypothetical protein BWR17_00285 [Phaeobacter inhibens]
MVQHLQIHLTQHHKISLPSFAAVLILIGFALLQAAAARGITIPGNRVIGVFNNDYAVRILHRSTAAMIEAPIRLYVTEDENGDATLSYKTAQHVFAPYLADGGQELSDIAIELDQHLDAIAQNAVRSAP